MVTIIDITVILATRNRAGILSRTLCAFTELHVDGIDWEIIIGDNGSGDNTSAVLEEFASRLPLTSFHEVTPGKNRCLNRAIDMAAGRLLIFTDDDVLPRPDWLQAYLQAATDFPEDHIFGGRIDLEFPSDTPKWIREISARERTFAFAEFVKEQATGPMQSSPTGPNLAIRAGVFDAFRYNESIGPAGNNYAMGSETELLGRLQRHGYRQIYVADACLLHCIQRHQTSLDWLEGRAFRLGRGQMADGLVTGRLIRDLVKSVIQILYILPSLIWNLAREDSRRFWALWHLRKSQGRVYEWWTRRTRPAHD